MAAPPELLQGLLVKDLRPCSPAPLTFLGKILGLSASGLRLPRSSSEGFRALALQGVRRSSQPLVDNPPLFIL